MTGDKEDRAAKLVCKICKKDENAFVEFYELYQHRIYAYIAKSISDRRDIEELVQDTFSDVWENIETLKKPEKVLNWMYRIAYQRIAGWQRKNGKLMETESFESLPEHETETPALIAYRTTEGEMLGEERRRALLKAISQLGNPERKWFHQRLQGMSYEDIAEHHKTTVSRVKSRIYRVRKRLRDWAEAWEEAQAKGVDLDFSEFEKQKREAKKAERKKKQGKS